MIELINNSDCQIELKLCQKIVKKLNIKNDIELMVVKDDQMKKLNKKYRGIDKTTDVLSFPLAVTPNAPLGSVVINIDKVFEVSQRLKHSFDEEFALLFLHGVLHLLGYNHENDNGQMRKIEEEIIQSLSLPKSLILRSF